MHRRLPFLSLVSFSVAPIIVAAIDSNNTAPSIAAATILVAPTIVAIQKFFLLVSLLAAPSSAATFHTTTSLPDASAVHSTHSLPSIAAANTITAPDIAAVHKYLPLVFFLALPSTATSFHTTVIAPAVADHHLTINPRQARLIRRNQMADNAALAAVLAQLAAAINNLPAGGAAAAAVPPAPNPVLDPLADNNALDLSSRAGETAFKQVCEVLDSTWDGTPSGFPAFLTAARVRAREGRWDVAGNTGICTVAGNDIFTAYHQITEAQATAAFQGRLNDRAVQNSKAFFRALKKSLTGTIHSTLFGQFANAPVNEDGVFLWIRLTKFTITSSLHLSVTAFQEILELDPGAYKFHIPTINSKLLHLFVLATTPHRQVQDQERIQHTVTVYARIQQPQSWATWVAHQIDRIEEGNINNHQDFMNSAALKYAKIEAKEGGFHASTNTIQEDIVAMMAKAKRKRTNPPQGTDTTQNDGPSGDEKGRQSKKPPFLKYYKVSEEANAKEHKVGDTRTWKNETYHYCDCPNHRGRVRWHKHKAEDCTVRKRWLEEQDAATANIATDGEGETTSETNSSAPAAGDTSPGQGNQDASALLANAYALLGSNSAVQELVADALTALADE